MWYKISLQQKKNPIKDTGIFLCICASRIHIEHFPSFPLSPPPLPLLCRPDAPALSLLIHISAAYLHRAPQWDFNHCDMQWKQRMSVSCAGEIEIGRREKAKNKPKAEKEEGEEEGGGGKVNIISFLTPWDRKQPPHTVKVQKVKALNQLLQLM